MSGDGDALMDAVARRDVTAVRDLLARGADPDHHRSGDAEPEIQPTTPLRLVVFCISDAVLDDDGLRVHAEIARILIAAGADPAPAMRLAELRYGPYRADGTGPFWDVWHLLARSWSVRRDPAEVLARARILSLLSFVEDGRFTELIPAALADPEIERRLTDRERAWFALTETRSVDDGYQVEAMLVFAWALGLCSLGDRDPEAYGPVLSLLQGLDRVRPEDLVAPRTDAELRAMLSELDAIAAGGDAPPPDERFGEPCLRWRRAALRWLLDPAWVWS